MNPSNPGIKLTYDDFVQFPDDGLRHELIDGEHYVTPSPIPRHQKILGTLFYEIRRGSSHMRWAKSSCLRWMWSSRGLMSSSPTYFLCPKSARLKFSRHKIFQGSPDLVVEIGSP